MTRASCSMYKTWVEINSKVLQHNLHVAQKYVGKNISIMAVVKSNAYGHGLMEIAHILGSKSKIRESRLWFGVDSLDEALALKKSGAKNSILILGYTPKQRLKEIVEYGFHTIIYDISTARDLARIAQRIRKKVLVHIKIETGTFRQGVVLKDIPSFVKLAKKYETYFKLEGAYSHFADTENTESIFYKQQFDIFQQAKQVFNKLGHALAYTHIAASAATLLYPETHETMIRWGISLYGLYPSFGTKIKATQTGHLQPVLTWKTRIAQVKEVFKGDTIGYDRTFTVLKRMTIAILPIGYWDGYARKFSNKGVVLVAGKRVPVIGNICMNICMIDITGISGIKPGDEVVLLGKQKKAEVFAEELAEISETINYEVVTRINPLIPRIII